jgi:hypothetical protein
MTRFKVKIEDSNKTHELQERLFARGYKDTWLVLYANWDNVMTVVEEEYGVYRFFDDKDKAREYATQIEGHKQLVQISRYIANDHYIAMQVLDLI